jgi:hypothetical protein
MALEKTLAPYKKTGKTVFLKNIEIPLKRFENVAFLLKVLLTLPRNNFMMKLLTKLPTQVARSTSRTGFIST